MTRLSLSGKLLGAVLIVAACLLTTAGTALSGGQAPPQKKIQIKIIVDGKEIDLGDPQLLEHIEAAQKKASVDTRIQVYKALSVVKPDQPAGTDSGVKPPAAQAAISPDAKVIVLRNGNEIKYLDAVSGKIIKQVDPAKPDAANFYRSVIQATPDAHVQRYFYAQSVQSKADPRIEELVKQAEAIKPGSGADIRKALQALPKPGNPVPITDPKFVKPVQVAPSSVRIWDTDSGKKMIIIAIEDGKVLQLSDGDLKKYLELGIRLHPDKDLTKQKVDEKVRAVELLLKANKVLPDKKAAPPTPAPAPDVEALSRQLERLNAELLELRKRIDAGKK